MSELVKLGGERLGSGGKMTVVGDELPRSNHDLSYIWRGSVAPGVLQPICNMTMLAGDRFEIELTNMTITNPTIGALYGQFKKQIDFFFVPIRLYQKMLHNNVDRITLKLDQIYLPIVKVRAPNLNDFIDVPISEQQINPTSILASMGVMGLGRGSETGINQPLVTREFNAVPLIAYYDIVKNYYANLQEDRMLYIDAPEDEDRPYPAKIRFIKNGAPILNDNDLSADAAGSEIWATANTATGWIVLNNIKTHAEYPNLRLIGEDEYDSIQIAYVETVPRNVNEIDIYQRYFAGYPPIKVNAEEIWSTLTYIGSDAGTSNIISLTNRKKPLYNTIVGVAENENFWRESAEIKINEMKISDIDDMRETILSANKATPLIMNDTMMPIFQKFAYARTLNYNAPDGQTMYDTAHAWPQFGLCLKTYQSDIFNNWLDAEQITGETGINAITAIDVSDGKLTIDALIMARKVYDMLNRTLASGGTYKDYMRTNYANYSFEGIETPIYVGGASQMISFQQVVSNTATEEAPLGTIAGKGVLMGQQKGGKFTVKAPEMGVLIGIESITPILDYSQGNQFDMDIKTLADYHNEALDRIGFQDLISDRLCFADTEIDEDGTVHYKSLGKQPAWVEYMTNTNKCVGAFAQQNNKMYMTLNRRYKCSKSKGLEDYTTYVNPALHNGVFAQTDLRAQNFDEQIAVNIKARRIMSAKVMPQG